MTRTKASLVCCALLHAGITCAYALTRLYGNKGALLDAGTIDQVLWNFTHTGEMLSTTNPPNNAQHWLGFHFSPILLLLAPLYASWPHIALLQIVQSLCVGFAGIPLFFALQALGARDREAGLGAALYWLNPFVLSAALWDFHEIAFAVLFISCALWALCARRFGMMTLALLLLLLTKEQYGVSVAGFGFLWGWRYKDWKRGGFLMAAGMLAAGLILAVIMPALHGGTHAMWSSDGSSAGRYGWINTPWPQLLQAFARLMFSQEYNFPGVLYLLVLLLSGLLLPLVAPLYLAPAAGDLLANLLSANPMQRHLASYHTAACIPVVLVAAYQGYRCLLARAPEARKPLIVASLVLAAVFPLTGLTLYPFAFWELRKAHIAPDADIPVIRALLQEKPVSAQANIGIFFSQRREIYPFPRMAEQAGTVVLHLRQPFEAADQERFNIPFGEASRDYIAHLRNFMRQPGWHITYWHAPWLVMTHGAPAQDERAPRAEIAQAIGAMDAPKAPPASRNP